MAGHVWLRHEFKPNERRAPITPEQVGTLVRAGHRVTVESSGNRVFQDGEYLSQGAEISAPGSWHNAPKSAFILGIKEQLQEEITARNLPLEHRHIYFAHIFKGQACTPETMRRFTLGKGALLDLEYLVDENGKRIAAFSYSAGFAGAIAAVYIWAEKQLGRTPPYPLPNQFLSRQQFVDDLAGKLRKVGRQPGALIIGANGRSGQGAAGLFDALKIDVAKWGRNETRAGGPFPEILDYDILCNCVFLAKPVAPFLTTELVARQGSEAKLSVVADVSNDLTYNPIFGISSSTSFGNATIRVSGIDVIEIENLPALTPLDSSVEYATLLFPHLLELVNGELPQGSIWERALLTYYQHQDIPQLAMECGRELAENYLAQTRTFGVGNITEYLSQIFSKNVLSETDRLYFVDYLTAGVSEILAAPEQDLFAGLLTKAHLDQLYHSPGTKCHHALLTTVYGFSRSKVFDCVKAVEARDDFYDMCEGLADMIDQKPGAEERYSRAREILLRKLGHKINDPVVREFFDELESPVRSPLHLT